MTQDEINALRAQITELLRDKASCWFLAMWNPGQPGDFFSSRTADAKEQAIRLLASLYDLLNTALSEKTPQQLTSKMMILNDVRKLICQLQYYTEVVPPATTSVQ